MRGRRGCPRSRLQQLLRWEIERCCLGGRRGAARGFSQLSGVGAQCPRDAAARDRGLDQACSDEIARALRQDVSICRPGLVAHATRQILQAEAESATIEIRLHDAHEYALELAHTRELPSAVSEVFPRRMSGTDL